MILAGHMNFEVIPGSMLEKGLKFAQKRQEELDNMRFQIQCLQSGGSLDDQARHRLDQLILEYNNWMYPHLERERKDFAEESAVKFNALKNLDLHKNKFKVDDSVDTSKPFKFSVNT